MKIFQIFILYSLFTFCIQNHKIKSIPENARFDKSRQVYFYENEGNEFAYYKNGTLYYKCLKKEENTKICHYFSKEGKIIGKGELVNNLKNGFWTWNFLNKTTFLKQNHNYKNKRNFWIPTNSVGNENGIFERFYPNGKLELIGFYEFGYKNKVWEKFYPNGQLEFKGEYTKDKKIKKWTYFYPNGKLEAEEIFDLQGELVLRTTFKPDGVLICKIEKNKHRCEE